MHRDSGSTTSIYRIAGLCLIAISLTAVLSCSAPRQDNRQASNGTPGLSAAPARSAAGFASRQKLLEHYQKHGREFGAISIEEYLRLAQDLRDRPAGGDVLEAVRADGVVTRFDRATGAFIAFNPQLTIRTYFKPNAGESYFRRQAQRVE